MLADPRFRLVNCSVQLLCSYAGVHQKYDTATNVPDSADVSPNTMQTEVTVHETGS